MEFDLDCQCDQLLRMAHRPYNAKYSRRCHSHSPPLLAALSSFSSSSRSFCFGFLRNCLNVAFFFLGGVLIAIIETNIVLLEGSILIEGLRVMRTDFP